MPAALERAGDGDARGLIAMDAANNQETPPSPGMANLDRTKRPTPERRLNAALPYRPRVEGSGAASAIEALRRPWAKTQVRRAT